MDGAIASSDGTVFTPPVSVQNGYAAASISRVKASPVAEKNKRADVFILRTLAKRPKAEFSAVSFATAAGSPVTETAYTVIKIP